MLENREARENTRAVFDTHRRAWFYMLCGLAYRSYDDWNLHEA